MAITLSSSTVTYPDGSTTTTNTPNATAALAVGAIGSYALCKLVGNATVRDAGFTVAGSSLYYATADSVGAYSGQPGGSWRLMGALPSYPFSSPKGGGTAYAGTSVWLRYA